MLPERHDAELRVPAGSGQVGVAESQAFEPFKAVGSHPSEAVKQVAERLPARGLEHRLAIERRKRNRVAVPQQVLDPNHPVGALAMNQMANDVEGTPCVRRLDSVSPRGGKILEQAAHDRRRPSENR